MSHKSIGRAIAALIIMTACALQSSWLHCASASEIRAAEGSALPGVGGDPAAQAGTKDWLTRWEQNILGDSRNRYCDKEMGEEIGWLVSPFLNGFYYGYLATHDPKWVDMLVDWTDSWIHRGIKEPDGYLGWPKDDGASTAVVPGLYTDNMLGDAMGFRPVVLMANVILKTPALKQRYGDKARGYLALSEQMFEKWDKRGCWREVHDGGLWVVPTFGIDKKTGQWTEGYARRATDGFSLPDNKENYIAQWLLAMYDVTHKPIYRQRAEKWWQVMRSRMKLREDGKYYVWDYWDPAGPWDYKPDGSTKHWVGVHPNGGYYDIDVEGIVAAYEHGLVFTRKEIDRLIATNRDYMWNHQITGAKFQRLDGGEPADPWKNSPGVLWHALVPYDTALKQVFEANHNPAGWGGLAATPWYLARQAGNPGRTALAMSSKR
jgi:hypothetical protein